MILKKPYAFLIRHFRMIHLFLLVPIAYLIHRTYKIVTFFRMYVKNNYSTTIIHIATEHINFFMYLAVLLIIFTVLFIYYLMRQKRKSTKLYFFIIIYYIFLFVLIGLTHSVMTNMEHNLITAQTARGYRDISLVLCLPEYFFFIYTLMRGIGFDVKKFNFANDLKDLEITAIDSEEFEFSIHVEGYKVGRTARRFLREMKYYIKENTFVFTSIICILFIFVGTLLYLNFGVYNKTYSTSDKMNHNYFTIQIADSMVTNMGYDGNVITPGKYYLVIKLYVENRRKENYELDYDNFRLVVNDSYIYPTLDRGEYFIDFGKPFVGEKIKKESKDYYVLAYEIEEKDLAKEYTIKILESIDYTIGEIVAKYKNIKLKPPVINKIKEIESLEVGKIANLKESNLKYTTFQLHSSSFGNSYTYSYEYCTNTNKCSTLKDKITTNASSTIEKTTLLILDMEYHLDETSIYANAIKSNQKFFEHFFSLRIKKNGETKNISLKNRTTPYMKNALVFETRYEALEADQVDLLLTVRDKQYVYHLK